jgi:hypothetical protein
MPHATLRAVTDLWRAAYANVRGPWPLLAQLEHSSSTCALRALLHSQSLHLSTKRTYKIRGGGRHGCGSRVRLRGCACAGALARVLLRGCACAGHAWRPPLPTCLACRARRLRAPQQPAARGCTAHRGCWMCHACTLRGVLAVSDARPRPTATATRTTAACPRRPSHLCAYPPQTLELPCAFKPRWTAAVSGSRIHAEIKVSWGPQLDRTPCCGGTRWRQGHRVAAAAAAVVRSSCC